MGKHLVVLDPGHGGWDLGIETYGKPEKSINLDVCLAMQEFLTAKGVEVRLTRADDSELTAQKRAALAEGEVVDLFLSWHCEALPDTKVQGVTLWVDAANSSLQRMIEMERIGECICQASGQDLLGVFLQQDKVLSMLPNTAAVIVHGAYLSNEQERKLSADPNFLRLQAQGAAEGILQVLRDREDRQDGHK